MPIMGIGWRMKAALNEINEAVVMRLINDVPASTFAVAHLFRGLLLISVANFQRKRAGGQSPLQSRITRQESLVGLEEKPSEGSIKKQAQPVVEWMGTRLFEILFCIR